MKKFAIIIIIGLGFTGCVKDDEVITAKEQLEIDIAIIDAYLGENNITAQIHESGLRYVIHVEGTGANPTTSDIVKVDYLGTLISDGTVFDQAEGVEFQLNQLILGWQIGFTLLKEGSEATLYLPSGLGYGTRGSGNNIPPNANLIFDVTLISVKK